jgi:hypothetical protein
MKKINRTSIKKEDDSLLSQLNLIFKNPDSAIEDSMKAQTKEEIEALLVDSLGAQKKSTAQNIFWSSREGLVGDVIRKIIKIIHKLFQKNLSIQRFLLNNIIAKSKIK